MNAALATLIEDFSLVRFIPLDSTDDDDVALVLQQADHCLQYGEEEEPQEPRELEGETDVGLPNLANFNLGD